MKQFDQTDMILVSVLGFIAGILLVLALSITAENRRKRIISHKERDEAMDHIINIALEIKNSNF